MEDLFEVQKDHPELIKVCLNCKYQDCIGRCRDYVRMKRKLADTGEIKVRTRGEPKLPTKRREEGRAMYEYNGKWYSIKQIAELTGHSPQTLYYRLIQTNGDMYAALDDEAFKRSRSLRYRAQLYEARGEMHTIHEWAEIMGMPYKRLYDRMNRGHTLEEALDMGADAKKGRPHK